MPTTIQISDSVKKTLDTIDKRQQEHFNDLIATSKDVEFQKKELERIDEEKDDKIQAGYA